MNLSNEDRKWFGERLDDVRDEFRGEFDKISQKLDKVNERLDVHHEMLDYLTVQTRTEHGEVKKELKTVRGETQKLDTKVVAMNKKFENRTDQLGDETEDHERRITRIEEMAVSV